MVGSHSSFFATFTCYANDLRFSHFPFTALLCCASVALASVPTFANLKNKMRICVGIQMRLFSGALGIDHLILCVVICSVSSILRHHLRSLLACCYAYVTVTYTPRQWPGFSVRHVLLRKFRNTMWTSPAASFFTETWYEAQDLYWRVMTLFILIQPWESLT